ncbi:MAG: hypothetical protein A3G41_07490 [Elusimicrobia bacterium RIFCSPLOWO2_12_FULL_59_9]|nr:MAG: hypothetical protein A3G41_07490 [Elusimicrobia bacterium RIFCSPLOWO2_12_FULL_59_9]
MGHRLEVRKAGPRDAKILAPLFDAYRRFYRQPSDVRAAERFLRRRLSRKESVVFWVRQGGGALGFAQLYPTFSSITLKRLWILNDLYVLPDGRRQGVAIQLMARARRLALDTGAEGLYLETAAGNRKARRLYEKLGWKREREFYRYYDDV